nr:unnamed protein product [Callosobruchus chinensis]
MLPEAPDTLDCIDFIGPLHQSRGRATYLLVFVDAFSKFVKLSPLKRATTDGVIRCASKYFEDVGKPKRILSDNGSQFSSMKWVSFLERSVVKLLHASVYYQQGNMTERVNRDIVRHLKAFCAHAHGKWAILINRAIHDSTDFSPAELHRQTKLPNPLTEKIMFPGTDGHKVDRVYVVSKRIRSRAEHRKYVHERDGKFTEFQVGDLVLERTHRQSSVEDNVIKKFFHLYFGPAIVISKKGANSYELKDSNTGISLGELPLDT